MKPTLEIACFCLEDALVAAKAGADRIEFCEDYEVGGITPSEEDFLRLKDQTDLPVFVMIQPRVGPYTYTPKEMSLLLHQMERFFRLGANGLVVGCTLPDGGFDHRSIQQMAPFTRHIPLTFHRAFDQLKDPFAAIDLLADLGFQRILCSGGPGAAWQHTQTLKAYLEYANRRLVILPGGGIRPDHVQQLVQETGCRELHSSAAIPVNGRMVVQAELIQELQEALQ